MYTVLSVLGSVTIVSLISLAGILLLLFNDSLIKRLLFPLVGFAAGALLGDVFIHIIPEIGGETGAFLPTASLLIAAGILLSFLLEKAIRWRHCHSLECSAHAHPVGSITLIGDAAHNVMDGILIAGSFLADVNIGIATTIAVILHEIPQEIGNFAILLHSGYTKSRALLLNLLTALTAILGAIAVLLLHSSLPNVERYLLPIVAGNFLYIAVADLLPELHKETKLGHSLAQFISVIAGMGLMYLCLFLE
jgi:zinc and cadmium transporter